MSKTPQIVCPWVTPKIFPRLDNPGPRVKEFFDHYAQWFRHADQVVVNFCTGNGDHILNYAGSNQWDAAFDWARYNTDHRTPEHRFEHNMQWLKRVREGGACSGYPYMAGPSCIVSEEVMTYRKLAGIYKAFYEEARKRGINFKLLEYLEPGP